MSSGIAEKPICTKCGSEFRVIGEEAIGGVIQDFPLIVHCPVCSWPNVVKWKRGIGYKVTAREDTP